MTGGNGRSRIDRIERGLERLTGDVEKLVGVVETLADHAKQSDVLIARLAEGLNRLEIAQAETTDKLNALIQLVDDWIRNQPRGNAS